MLQLLSLNKTKIAGLIEYKDLCIESVLETGNKTLSFLYPKNAKNYYSIIEECYIKTKTNEFIIKESSPQGNYTSFVCELNLEELEGKPFDRYESVEQTITAALNLAIVGTGWTVADNTIKKKRTVRKTDCSSLEIVQEIKKTYRVDIEFDTLNKIIKVYEHLGEDKGTYFIDSLNLRTLEIQGNSYDYATRIIPIGKDGLTIESINNGKNYVENYQYSNKVKTIFWKDDRYTIVENLKEDAEAKLKEISKPYRSYEAEIINLAKINKKYKVLDYKLGDTISIISRDNKIKDKQRIVKTIEYPQNHNKDTVELSNTILSFENIQKQFQDTSDTVDNVTLDNGTLDGEAFENGGISSDKIDNFKANVIEAAEIHVIKGDIQDLNVALLKAGQAILTKVDTAQLNALESKLQHALIGKADVNELNVAVERVGILEGKTLSVENQLAGNLTAKNFKANSITARSGIIAEGAIGSAQISSLSVNKLEAGEFITSKHKIISADGTIEIVGNQILINRDNINRVVLGEYRKQDNTTDYGLLIRAKDGKTIMLDSEGVHNAGITNGAVDNNKVADNANIAGNKLDINSVIREVNNNGTETIKGTKVTVGDRTLDVELSTQKNIITEHSKELSTQKTSIQALDNAIKLKVDNQTFTQSTNTINSNINSALNSAKEFTTAQIRTTNSNLSKATSEINILKEQINTKVGQVDINKSIQEIKIGGRNYIVLKNIASYMPYNTAVNENGVVKLVKKDNTNFITLSVLEFTPANKKYTLSGIAKLNGKPIPKDFFQLNRANTYNSGDRRVIIKDNGSFEITETWTGNTGWIFHTPVLAKPNDIIIFEKLKFEEGEFATTYTEAPEDLNNFIINNIKVVTDKINDVSTKLVQVKDSLQASVNSLNSTTQTITTNLTNTTNNLTNKINTAKTDAINSANNYTNTAKKQAIVGARNIPDTRSTNESPQWYMQHYSRQFITEFKYSNTIGISATGNPYGTLETKVPWNDASGGYPVQTFRSNSTATYQRHGTSNTAWSSWEQIEDTQGSQNKANSALNNAKTYTNAQITTVNTRVSNVESSINILKGQISTKVSQSDIDRTVNNIEFGGRNLIPNSYINAETSAYGSFGRTLTIHLEEDKTYCFSIRGHIDKVASDNGKSLTCFIYEDTWSYGSVSINIFSVNSNETKYALFIPKKTGVYKFAAYMYPSGGNREGKVALEWAKFEKGTKPTDWTPAPEDANKEIKDNITIVTEKINTVESTFTQKTNNINATVSSVQSILKTKADGSTVSSMQSQLSSLNIGLNGIKTEVNKKTDKGSIISEINQSAESVKINASKIELNGVTTFSNATGLKAIEIQNNSIDLYNFNNNGELIGSLTSVVKTKDNSKPGIELVNYKNSFLDIGYFDDYLDSGASRLKSYIIFDKYKVRGEVCPIAIYEDVCLHGRQIFLDDNKGNSFFESTTKKFILKVKHGVEIEDTDTGNVTALLGSDRAAFSKWNQKYYYAEFFPGGFSLSSGNGESYLWAKAGSSDIWTKVGVNMRIQGDLSVRGSKNRIVDTIYGDLTLNAVESTECWFTDMAIEQNRTDNNGDCIIWFDNKFLSTVNTGYKYKIDVTPIGEFASNGKLTYVRVVEKTEKYFKVSGTPNTLFDWTITAKQKGYERDRLETMEKAS